MSFDAAYKGYVGAMWDGLSALATWQPDVRLSVGDIVTAGAGGVVTRETTLAALGVSADRLTCSRYTAAPVRVQSGVTISASGSAVVVTAGQARAKFLRQSSFLVVTDQGWLDAVDNTADARAVVEDLEAGELWRPGWHLVTSVRVYPACTIVIAKSAGAEAEVSVDVTASGLVPEAVRAGASVSVNSDHASHWAMSFDCTPLYEAIAMKRRGLRRHKSVVQVEYLTRDHEPAGAEGTQAEEEFVWTVQQSSPHDLGLL